VLSKQTSKRPFTFVPHGLGGIIVKSVGRISEDISIRSTDGHRRSSTHTLKEHQSIKLFFHPSLMHSKAAAESSDLEKATDRCSQDMAKLSSGRLTADHHAHNSGPDRERASAAGPLKGLALLLVIVTMLSAHCCRSIGCAPSVVRSFGNKTCPFACFGKELPFTFLVLTPTRSSFNSKLDIDSSR
jgi:hypothetical protein